MRALEIPWPADELERRYRGATSAYAAKRYQALWLRAQGVSVKAVAATVGVTPETLRAWVHRATAAGLDALAARRPGSGGRPKLTGAQQAQVRAWADAAPRVTLSVLRARIAREWGVSLSEPQVWRLLRRGDFRRVVPRKRHYRADPAAQAAAQKNWAC